MTLEEAIRHCYETAERENCECSSEHLRLAHWLEELQRYRSAGKTKEKMTNEEWFCALSTKDKAKFLAAQQLHGGTIASRSDVDWEVWLEEKYNEIR